VWQLAVRCVINRGVLDRFFLGLSLVAIFCMDVAGQEPAPTTGTEVWPEIDGHMQFADHLRLLTFAGTQQGVGFPYQQWYAAAGLGYQWKYIGKPHLENIDPDKEHHFVFGLGYEFLRTIQSGKTKDENRLALQGTLGFRLPAEFLVRDRNEVELRWINGAYSTTYRNRIRVEHDFLLRGFRFTPYGSVEFFYDGAKNSWNEQWYSAGVEWPYKHLFMLDTYYLRQNCTTCSPANLNVAGITLSFYFGHAK
jgi:hypothetical protein